MIVVFALVAMACSLSLPAQTASTPTSVAKGVDQSTAAPTLTLTLRPTQTPTGTKTPYPTITPIPTQTFTPTITPLGAGPTPTPQYACQLIDKYPDNWMEFKPHVPFEARWTLKNTGTKTWVPGELVVKYISGVEMYAIKDYESLKTETPPDSLVLIIADMISPKKSGQHITTWGLVESRTKLVLCLFNVKITVK